MTTEKPSTDAELSETSRQQAVVKRPVIPSPEMLLRQHSASYGLASGWSAGFNAERGGWQVFWRGCDANFRIGVGANKRVKAPKFHETFEKACDWITSLKESDLVAIARSV